MIIIHPYLKIARMTAEALANNETTKTSRALIILFPDTRTVGGPNYLSERELTPFEQRLRNTSEAIIKRYKRNGFKIIGVVYKDTSDHYFSHYYPDAEFDQLIPMQLTFSEWSHPRYKSGIPELTESMNFKESAKILIGGYHATDCIAQFTAFLQDQGLDAEADLRLSDKLPALQLLHMGRNATRLLDDEVAWQDYQSWQRVKQEVEDEIRKRRKT